MLGTDMNGICFPHCYWRDSPWTSWQTQHGQLTWGGNIQDHFLNCSQSLATSRWVAHVNHHTIHLTSSAGSERLWRLCNLLAVTTRMTLENCVFIYEYDTLNIVEEWKTNLMSLAILFHFLCAQHVSDISTGLSKKMDGIWNRYNLKSTGRIYTFCVLKCSEKFKVLDLP